MVELELNVLTKLLLDIWLKAVYTSLYQYGMEANDSRKDEKLVQELVEVAWKYLSC